MNCQKSMFTAVAMAGLMTSSLMMFAAEAQTAATTTYKAEFAPLNAKEAGSESSGEAVFTISGDRLTIHITAKGAPPDTEHWQHLHGFAEGDKHSRCPTANDDANGDGIIDLAETEPAVGTTMVPFNANPVAMDIPQNSYPMAGADGSYTYDKAVSLKALQQAFEKQFPGQQLDLEKRVVVIHGIPSSTKLPPTVASLDGIPAHVTLPIACGKIEKSGS